MHHTFCLLIVFCSCTLCSSVWYSKVNIAWASFLLRWKSPLEGTRKSFSLDVYGQLHWLSQEKNLPLEPLLSNGPFWLCFWFRNGILCACVSGCVFLHAEPYLCQQLFSYAELCMNSGNVHTHPGYKWVKTTFCNQTDWLTLRMS